MSWTLADEQSILLLKKKKSLSMLFYSSRMTSSWIESKPGDRVRLVGDALVVADVFDGFCIEETIKGRLKITSNFS